MPLSNSAKKTVKEQEVQRIMDALSASVAQHRLKPGQRLVEAQIVEALNANRNHVQTALQRLAMRRIVSIEPNKGASVAQPTAQEARDIFAARRAIERGILENISAQHINDRLADVEAHMRSERQATAGSDRRTIVARLSEFHLLLADICGNTVFKEMFDTLMVRSSLIVALYQRNDVPSCASDEHQDIIDALLAGDHSTAIDAMIEHLNELESQLVLNDGQDAELDLADALQGL
ncbi:GntR family transcriptional regulator [Saccharospirillum sp. MSK14-1]|uniref:GntR family transcriptional regulator n=1 Tax=Saccharospirillum sp. MSK14-1 TaxID=1897632 RepID=UPI000D3B6246|nr:GntR family transcriptional regulator [Saccharospirillum sp. MSK14-1]PTY36520.1 GntR family transcriptional regulator [Saccharospirillum sp. MSK14-1]